MPIVAITGQVVEQGHRHRRLPGGRHPRHHDADHEAQLPRDRRGGDPAGASPRRSTSPATGRPGPVLVDISKDALQATTTFSWPPQIDLPGYRPVIRPHSKQIREAARLIAAAKRPVLYVGGGVIRSGASERAAAARRAHPDPGRHHADGARARCRTATRSTSACRACTAPSRPSPALQKSDLLITLGARFDDRVTGQLSTFAPGRQGHPRRHRPGRDLQEPRRRRADRRRRKEVISDLIDAADADRAAGRRGDYSRVAGEHVAEWKATFPLGYTDTEDGTLAPQYVIERIGAAHRPGGRSTSPASASTRCGPPSSSSTSAPTPGSTPAASARWATRCPAAMGAKVGRARPHRVGDRRRRLLPDDQPGARHLRHQQHPDQGRDHQQLQPRHGAPVADAVLQRALLQHRPAHQQPASGSPTSSSSPRPTAASGCGPRRRRTSTP